MSKYLVTVTEVYRVDTEGEVEIMLEQAKHSPEFTLVKYNSEKKEKKSKGEIVEEWRKVTLVKAFNEEKDPCTEVDIKYEVSF